MKWIFALLICVAGHEWAVHSVARECERFGVFYNGTRAYTCARDAANDSNSTQEADDQRQRSYANALKKMARTGEQIVHNARTNRGAEVEYEKE